MFLRANSVKINRAANKKISGLVSFVTVFVFLLIFCFVMIIVSETSFGPPTTEDPELYARLAELNTWGRNQSTNITSYLDLYNLDSFVIQPAEDKERGFNESSKYCGPNTKILFIVTSSPVNLQARLAIRQTWGSKSDLASRHAKVLFIMGISGNDTVNDMIQQEASKFGDIIQESFLDTYHNLTIKSMALLKWVNLTCPHDNQTNFLPQYVVKTDDDIFINIDRMIQILLEKPKAKLIGRLTCGAMPISDAKSKLYMPKYLFPGKVYPGYLSGTGYVIKSEIISILLNNSLTVPLIHLEDIYVTALLARGNKILPEDSVYFTYDRNEPKSICAFKNLVTSHHVYPKEMRFIWAHFRKPFKCNGNPKKQKYIRRAPTKLNNRLKKLCMFDNI